MEDSHTEEMFTEYIIGKGAWEITVHHPDRAYCCGLDRANIPTSVVIEYKNLKELEDAWLSVSEAVDTKVKDSHLLQVKTTKYSEASTSFLFLNTVMAATQVTD